MAIVYPIDLPASPTFNGLAVKPWTLVGVNTSPFTGQMQTYVWPGQRWMFKASLPPLKLDDADNWVAALLSLNGLQGSFLFGDTSRRTTRGNQAGVLQVGAGALMLSTVLPVQYGAGGAGALVKGDWVQISTYLYKIIKVNAGSYDVWPRLRLAHAQGSVITYTNAQGIFKLACNDDMSWNVDAARVYGVQLQGVEFL